MPHSQPTALQQTACKFHLDPQYHIFHWVSTILGDSTLWISLQFVLEILIDNKSEFVQTQWSPKSLAYAVISRLLPEDNVEITTQEGYFDIYIFIAYVYRGGCSKCLNLITAPGLVSNQPGSVTWLATAGISKIHAVSWRNHIENLTKNELRICNLGSAGFVRYTWASAYRPQPRFLTNQPWPG